MSSVDINQTPESDDEVPHDFRNSIENFIPLRHGDLFQKLQEKYEFSTEDRDSFRHLYDRLAAIFHVEHLTALLRVEELYDPLDPDCEGVVPDSDQTVLKEQTDQLFDRISGLLYSAHYFRLSRNQLEEAIQLGSAWGPKLIVDFELFDRLEVFARGFRLVERRRRRWQKMFNEETTQVPEFKRLVLAFKLRPQDKQHQTMRSDAVYLKNFKNIPETELEMLLPGTRVKLSALDRGKILLPTISGVALTYFKYFRLAAFLTLLTITGIWNWMVLIVALLAYISKSFFTYFRTKDKYQLDLTQSLYLKNLDNNAGVLYRLFNEAEEQELCETILGYTMLLKHAGKIGITDQKIDDLAEEFLLEYTGTYVDFDLHDSVGKWQGLGWPMLIVMGIGLQLGWNLRREFCPKIGSSFSIYEKNVTKRASTWTMICLRLRR